MLPLPSAPPLFEEKKAKILAQLSLPPEEYTDLSPKGSVDEGLLDVIDEVNATDGFVTTSSCAGRASVFLEGSRVRKQGAAEGTVAGVGGKGGGGTWLYVSHDPFEGPSKGRDWDKVFGLKPDESTEGLDVNDDEKRFIHFKFEPMVGTEYLQGKRRGGGSLHAPGRETELELTWHRSYMFLRRLWIMPRLSSAAPNKRASGRAASSTSPAPQESRTSSPSSASAPWGWDSSP